VTRGVLLAIVLLGAGCEPSPEERAYTNARDLLLMERAKALPEPVSVFTVTNACRSAERDRERLRGARKLIEQCDPLPEVWYYQKALAAFPKALAGASELLPGLTRACEYANSTLGPSARKGAPRDRDRIPAAAQLVEECDRSLAKLAATAANADQ
jgi:hypothetical protein